jgi:hypothetical protein
MTSSPSRQPGNPAKAQLGKIRRTTDEVRIRDG